jgi:hypothetical protein
MAGTFSSNQTVFFLSLLANLGSGLVGSVDEIETALAAALASCLDKFKPEIGSWEVVWGPAVFQARVSVRAENAMFVAQDSSDPSRYIIAIAGTNPYSAFDWIVEDVFVASQIDWEFGNPPNDLKPALAEGTHRGFSIVQQLRPGPDRAGNSTTLHEFLQGLPPGKVNITTAGHSLGGALAPVTALWLSDTQSQWDPDGRATISCFPSAGPTPGNLDFVTYYARSPLASRTTRIHNKIDVVPHAFAKIDLAQIPTLYQPEIQPDLLVQGLVTLAILFSQNGNYAQLIPDAPALDGKVDSDSIDPHARSFDNFIVQMGVQHVDAYLTLMGIDQFRSELEQVRQSAQLFGSQGAIVALEQKVLRGILMAKRSGAFT